VTTEPFGIGFTGTRRGMVPKQYAAFQQVLEHMTRVYGRTLHHGMCIGADFQAHHYAATLGMRRVLHPPVVRKYIASITTDPTMDTVRPALEYRARNKLIVGETLCLIATPKEPIEAHGGGTWMTIRIARDLGRPIYIVWPDGHIRVEGKRDYA